MCLRKPARLLGWWRRWRLGFHFHLFIFTALAPVLLWVLMNRAFVQALWSQAINVQPQALGRATEQGTQ